MRRALTAVLLALVLMPGSAAANPTPDQVLASMWAEVAPRICTASTATAPTLHVGPVEQQASGEVHYLANGTRLMVLPPGTYNMLGHRGYLGELARFTVLHEWAHYFQILGTPDPWVEVGADAFAYALAPRFGIRGWDRSSAISYGRKRVVRLASTNRAWVLQGQFGC